MIALQYADYGKVKEPLDTVPINTLFVKAVIYGQVPGTVYVDAADSPRIFYIVHPYGMSLLFGNTDNEAFNRGLYAYLMNAGKVREGHEWLQVYPGEAWRDTIRAMLGENLADAGDAGAGKVTAFTRVNFVFDEARHRAALTQWGGCAYEAVPTTPGMYEAIEGAVIPRFFWRDAVQFDREGAGYSVICDGQAASTAFASYRHGDELEIGIETMAEYRGRGFAFHAAAALIGYCLQNGLTPVWSCRLENGESYRLAQRLGFVPSGYLPYYRLPF